MLMSNIIFTKSVITNPGGHIQNGHGGMKIIIQPSTIKINLTAPNIFTREKEN